MSDFTLATWNIGSLYANIEVTLPFMQMILEEESPDLLCLQELPDEPKLWEKIAIWGDYSHRIYQITSPSHINKAHNMGIGIFSRVPLYPIGLLHLTKPDISVVYQGKSESWHDKIFMAVTWGASADGAKTMCCTSQPATASLYSNTAVNRNSVFACGLLLTGHGFPFHRYNLDNDAHQELIAEAFSPLDDWIVSFLEKPYDLPFFVAADFNIANPLKFLPRCGPSWIDLVSDNATRPSGRKTDSILVSRKSRLSPTLCIRKTVVNNSTPLFDHFYVSAKF